MALSRAALAAELWGRLQRPFTEIGITNSDTSGNLKEPVDATLLALGTAWDDVATGTVNAGDELKAITLVTYYGYAAVVRAFVDKDIQVDAPAIRISRSNQGNRYDRLLAEAKAAALPWLPDGDVWGSGTINLGFISTETEVWA